MGGAIRASAVRAVVLYEGRYLLAQHHNYLPGTIGKWGLPGGRIESKDADLCDALRRELHEEFAITIDIIGYVAMYTYRDRAHHIYLAYPHTTDLKVNASEILDITWLTLAEVTEWHTRGLLHTGFELPAIRASVRRFSGRFNAEDTPKTTLDD